MEFEGRKKVNIHLNITPLIDIVLQLIIFFMLTANFIMQPGIDINLPDAKTAAPVPRAQVSVYVSNDGRVFVNEKETGMDGLENAALAAAAGAHETKVMFRADEAARFGSAVTAIDILRSAGMKDLIIMTDIKESGK